MNRIAMLQGLANVARASKFSLLNADFSLQFAALRLASADVRAVDVSTATKEELLLKAFDRNMAVFTKSWRLEVLVPEKFRMLTLRKLGVVDLQQLRNTLVTRWQVEIEVRKGDGQADLPNVYVTPACR